MTRLINQGDSIRDYEPLKDIIGLNLFITRRCNLKCSYCFVDKTNAKDISYDILESSIAFIQKCSQLSRKKIHVGYIGGEPMLNWHLFRDVTNRLHEFNNPPEIGFTTNGTLLTQSKIEFIRQHSLRVVLSFDGDIRAMNDRLFINGKPSYNAVRSGVELLLFNNISFLVQLTITPNNVSNLFDNVRHLIKLGISKLIFGYGKELEWTQSSLVSLSENMIMIFQFYKTIYRNQYNVIFKYIDDEILSYLVSRRENACIEQVCPMAHEVFAIDIDGKIYPCQAFINSDEWMIGNVSTGFDFKRRRLASSVYNGNLEPCQRCKLLKFCRKCPCSNYLINGTPFLMEGFSCFLGKLTYSLVHDFVTTMYKERNLRFLNEYATLIEQWNLEI